MIEIVSGAQRWQVRLANSPSARDFRAQLPLKLTLKDYASTEKVGDLPRKLTPDGAAAAITPVRGDVTFYAPWGNLAIFYKEGHHSPGLVRLGRIEGEITGLSGSGTLEVTIHELP
ncbi:cyclophilin-like fold protein [Sphingomonas phyllosphaerae]|uniref:cyclophilin-like fold protein n=1 Tax=Sphingomonas phyllosphaerae TaxID=257003 RepID=UPI00241352A3|nr:cyclophilin-like fold protein [Sphingomonas phyllosphaerae]